MHMRINYNVLISNVLTYSNKNNYTVAKKKYNQKRKIESKQVTKLNIVFLKMHKYKWIRSRFLRVFQHFK